MAILEHILMIVNITLNLTLFLIADGFSFWSPRPEANRASVRSFRACKSASSASIRLHLSGSQAADGSEIHATKRWCHGGIHEFMGVETVANHSLKNARYYISEIVNILRKSLFPSTRGKSKVKII